VKNLKRLSLIGAAVAALVTGFVTTPAAHAEGAHYYILIGGTCNGNADQYQEAWLRGGIRKVVNYPAGASGLPGPCGQTPMDQSVAIGREEAKRVAQDAYHEDPGGEFTVVGYSQGAIVANFLLNDIADGVVDVDRSHFTAKLYADPMQPVGPPGRGISAVIPAGAGAPSPFGGYVSFGPGRTDFGGIPYIRYCIQTDGVCHFDTLEAPGGYFAQHWCYVERPIMADTLADGVYTNSSIELPRQDCRPPWPIG
jgi:hypothetical protein